LQFSPLAPTQLSGTFDDKLLEKAEYICIESPKLLGGYNEIVINEIKNLLRITNSYYSNRIESEGTHPINIEKAMKKEFSEDTKEKQLQYLSLAYIQTQIHLENTLHSLSTPFDTNFQKEIHKEFYSYEGMKDFLTIKRDDKSIDMIPGQLREEDVMIGDHVAVPYQELENIMKQFNEAYNGSIRHGLKIMKILYILSSHHRFVWIHPFLDGNGRTSRLLMDSLITFIGIEGYGLWNISRGLARNNSKYKSLLAAADEIRTSDYDGRGNLTNKGLYQLVDFMLDVAIDQIDYMKSVLSIKELSQRIENYVEFAKKKMYRIEPLPKHTDRLLKELLIKGSLRRGDVEKIIGTKQTVASTLIKELIQRDYIQSDTARGDIRIKFNAHFSMKIFPELMPDIET
jgi:Fic family protein